MKSILHNSLQLISSLDRLSISSQEIPFKCYDLVNKLHLDIKIDSCHQHMPQFIQKPLLVNIVTLNYGLAQFLSNKLFIFILNPYFINS